MSAIYRYELRRAFSGLRGWLFGAVLLLTAGISAAYYCFYGGSADVLYVLYGAQYGLILAVPYLCMDSLAPDRKSGNETFLSALPVSTAELVWGKYLALLGVAAVPIGLLCLLPLLFAVYGTVDMASSYSSLLSFFLLAADLIAICQLLSALTSRRRLAGLVGLGALILVYVLPLVSLFLPEAGWVSLILCILLGLGVGALGRRFTGSWVTGLVTAGVLTVLQVALYVALPTLYEGLFSALCVSFSPFLCFEQATGYGLFDLSTLLLLLSVPVLFISLTVAVLKRRRLA